MNRRRRTGLLVGLDLLTAVALLWLNASDSWWAIALLAALVALRIGPDRELRRPTPTV